MAARDWPMAGTSARQGGFGEGYDGKVFHELTEEYSDYSDFHNLGYWGDGASSQREASEALVDKLLDLIPDKSGSILDVACGKGATTRHLLRHYDPAQVTAINISDEQLERTKVNAPGTTALHMDAVDLDFEDASFDNIICVEAAFHFDTRRDFLVEARRVLKPGGRLVLSDLLHTRLAEERAPFLHAANFVPDLASYESILLEAGFESAGVINATDECATSYYMNLFVFLAEKFRERQIGGRAYTTIVKGALAFMNSTRYYLLAWAQAPGAGR